MNKRIINFLSILFDIFIDSERKKNDLFQYPLKKKTLKAFLAKQKQNEFDIQVINGIWLPQLKIVLKLFYLNEKPNSRKRV